MSYGVHIISLCQLCDQWDWSVGSRTVFISPLSLLPSFSLKTSLSPLLLSLCLLSSFSVRVSLYLFHSLTLPVPRPFFFWPGRPSQCEIMVNAPWQSDTTHSPGPAPSGFNLIWSEKRVCVCVVEGLLGGGGGWRDGGLGACWRGWRTRWKLGVLFSAEWSHHPSFFPNCPLPSSHKALTPPQVV